MAVVGYAVIIGALAAMAVLGLRWTRTRPGERRLTPFEEPGTLDPQAIRDRMHADAVEWDDPA